MEKTGCEVRIWDPGPSVMQNGNGKMQLWIGNYQVRNDQLVLFQRRIGEKKDGRGRYGEADMLVVLSYRMEVGGMQVLLIVFLLRILFTLEPLINFESIIIEVCFCWIVYVFLADILYLGCP
jgi:hypothetical protein